MKTMKRREPRDDSLPCLGQLNGVYILAKKKPEKNASFFGRAIQRAKLCMSHGHEDWRLPEPEEAALLSAAFKKGRLRVSRAAAAQNYWTRETAYPCRPLATSFNLRSGARKTEPVVVKGQAKCGVWLVRREPMPKSSAPTSPPYMHG